MKNKPNILVAGSFMMDNIVSTEIFPRQGQTVAGTGFRKAPGGKGANQAVQAARLGTNVTMFGKVGDDADGKVMLKTAESSGVDVSAVITDADGTSGCAAIILEERPGESTQNRIIIVPGTNMQITEKDTKDIIARISSYDLVMLQLEIPLEINMLIAKAAHEAGVPVMLNSAPSAPLPDSLLSCLTFISPNEHEAEDLTGIHIKHEGNEVCFEDARAAAKALTDKGIKNVLITLGSAGAVLYSEGKEYYSPCAENVIAVDPTAAGDSFVAAFCVGYCCGWDMESILKFANHTAAITVSGMGAMPSLPTVTAVEEFLASRGINGINTDVLK